MKLSIIILTWNSKHFVENCINSLYNSVNKGETEIIVVDNGSTDGTPDFITKSYPEVMIIRNSVNCGVAPARNQGIRSSSGEYILILDIDTVLLGNSIASLLAFMEEDMNIGLCGPRLVFEDGTMQKSCRRFPLIYTKVLRRVNTVWSSKILEKEYYDLNLNRGQAFFVDYVIGACQLIRRSAIDETGYLDDKIFYGPEDVDLCLRMWLKGWKVAYVPEAVVVHYEQRITKKKLLSKVTFEHAKGLIYYFIKHKYGLSRRGIYKRIRM